MKKSLSIFIILCLLLSGCSKAPHGNNTTLPSTEEKAESNSSAPAETPDFAQEESEIFTERDQNSDYEESASILIELSGSTAKASDESVGIEGSTITITKDAPHILSGALDDGMILIDAPETAKMQLILNGASISSQKSAPLYIRSADKVFLTLAEGTENSLSSGESFEAIDENNIDGALFSKQDLTINGSGSLSITAPAGHGIVCKDDLVFAGGTIDIQSAAHGLDANDSIRIEKASLTIDAGKDGLHAENTEDTAKGFIYLGSGDLKIEAEGDGLSASSTLQMEGGTIEALCGGGYENGESKSSGGYGGFGGGGKGDKFGGGKGGMGGNREEMEPPMMRTTAATLETTAEEEASTSMKGLKAASGILINGGTLTLDCADDALHSDGDLTINGGSFTIASGDDAIHAEKILTLTNGTIHISNSYEGFEALELYLKGGTTALTASDDGLNASGGNDQSGMTGGRDGMFGGIGGGKGGMSGPSAGNGKIQISGGKLTIRSGGDGMDANGSLEISGGEIYIANPTAGDTSVLDSDQDPIITGGTFLSTGSTTMMAQSFSSASSQGVIACTVGNQPAGTAISVKSGSETLLSYEAEYQTALVIISSPKIKKGEEYTLSIGSQSATIAAN